MYVHSIWLFNTMCQLVQEMCTELFSTLCKQTCSCFAEHDSNYPEVQTIKHAPGIACSAALFRVSARALCIDCLLPIP